MSQEPLWWQRARELHARGLSITVIGRLCNKDRSSVLYVINAEARARSRARSRIWAAKHPHIKKRTPEEKTRHLIVSRARAEARETGRHIDEVLIGWKTYPRRSRESRS